MSEIYEINGRENEKQQLIKKRALIEIKNWNDIFYSNNNNLSNYSYSDLNQIILKSTHGTLYRGQ